jgi:low temperature requirement protein LtrA
VQYVLWVLAAIGAYGSLLVGYYVPGLGRARTQEWPVRGAHFAERCRLFILIALAESLLVTGTTFSGDPGRLARSASTYFHLPIIAGIIAVAA